jgi:GNAT superfamily N-acetyltransferase
MSEIQIRPTVATDLSRLMAFEHSASSDAVWQLELRKDAGQVQAMFREVRLPRAIKVEYPHSPFSLPDDWVKRSMMFTALVGRDPAGYISLIERGSASIAWVADLVVDLPQRRRGVGSALLAAGQAWAESRAHRRVILEIQSKNHPAIRLAQKFGYEFCGYNDHYFPSQDVALFFVKVYK